MQRWPVMALCLALVTIGTTGCALKTSSSPNPSTSQVPERASAWLTAIDVDVFHDHTLVTLQSDNALSPTVRRDDNPPRLIIDLPGHAVAPGVRALEVYRGGVTVIQPVTDPGGDRSRVEIGLLPSMTHTWSLPFRSTLLVELRPETSARTPPDGVGGRRAQAQASTLLPGGRRVPQRPPKAPVTLGNTTPGAADHATEVIGVAVEPLDDRTRVRVVGDGPILTYKTARSDNPSQLILSLPSLTTPLAGEELLVPTPQLTHLVIRPSSKEGAAIAMALAAGVSPEIVRQGSEVLVELSQPLAGTANPSSGPYPRVIPASAHSTAQASTAEPIIMAQETERRAPAAEGAPVYTGQRISLDFQQADLIDVLRLISEVSGRNIITSPDVSGRVTTRMVNVPWDQALDVILKTHGLGKEQEGTIIRVSPLERLRKERDAELQAQRVAEELEAPVTRTVQLSYARAEELKANMEKLLTKQGRLDIDKRTNTIIVKDVNATVDEILGLIRGLDSQTRQVAIETRIVETSRTFLQELGVRWGGFVSWDTGVKFPGHIQLSGRQGPTPVGGNFAVDLPTVTQPPAFALGFSLISNSSIIDYELQALERNGQGRIISNPKVVTLDNKEALVESGDEVPFKTETAQTGPTVQFKDAKITLRVTPHISPDDFVLLEIDAAKKEVDFSRLVEGNPTITSRQSTTSILVKDGATAVIGGLFKRTTAENREGVPGLSKIPYLGWLFKNQQTREDNDDLLFFITPRIVRDTKGARLR